MNCCNINQYVTFIPLFNNSTYFTACINEHWRCPSKQEERNRLGENWMDEAHIATEEMGSNLGHTTQTDGSKRNCIVIFLTQVGY